MRIGYRRAQYLLKTLQESFASPLVITKRGGGSRGGAALWKTGEDLIARNREFQGELERRAEPFLEWIEQNRPENPRS